MTIQKSALLIAGLMFTGLVSCNSESDTESVLIDNASVPVAEPPATATTPATVTVQPAPAAPALTETIALNPAHGQPGHDCAVAVGAPLNGTASVSTANSARVIPPPTSSPLLGPAPSFNASTSNLNPAHGQPGHDCAVAVGAPLNGTASVSTANSARVIPPPTPSPLLGPAPTFNASTSNLNPAHGQPGHDCAVAVGAPLPSR